MSRRARRFVDIQSRLLAALATGLAVALGGAARPALAAPPSVRPAAVLHATAADTARLRRTLDSLSAGHHGVVGYAIHNLETGERLGRRADEPFPTASLIKVAILVTVFDLVEQGMLSLDDKLTVLRIDKVPGAGQLQFLHDGAEITVRDAAWLMTTISDNTATNLLLDRIIIRRVWAKMEALGLPRTKPHAKSFQRISSVAMDSSVKYGLGVSTPNESVRLFELLARGQAVHPRADSVMLDILAHNEDGKLLQRHVSDLRSPHKTGTTDSVRTECALWRLPDRVVACVYTRENADTRWILDSEPQLLMARMGAEIVRTWRGDGAR